MPDAIAVLDRAARRHATPCGDGTMVWREWGPGVPVVLLHGGYGSWQHWMRNIAPLTEAGYRVIAPDLPGLGESAMPPPTDNLDDVSDIVGDGLARVLAPGERFHLVGFSFGGQIAGRIAVRLGVRVRSFTIVGAGGLGLPRGRASNLRRVDPGMSGAEIAALQRDNLGRFMVHDPAKIDDTAVWMQIRHIALGRFKSVPFAPGDRLARALPLVKAPIGGIWASSISRPIRMSTSAKRCCARSSRRRGSMSWRASAIGCNMRARRFNRVLLEWLART